MNGGEEIMDSVFDELYDKYHQELYQFLFYMVKNHETAEDLVQEVYIRVLKSYEHFEGKSSQKTWLYSIAKNAAIDHFRKQKGWKQRLLENFDWDKQPLKDDQPLPEEIALLNDEMQFIYHSLNRCTVNQKSVIILRFIQGLSIFETAEILNWSEGKVKTTQHRALKAIKKYMQNHAGEEGHHNEEIPME
ncbi:RNA polymerase sigma factor SigX [Peribacillus loiseleuriae]|uniref:RNA polymerase sigma factor SigX n=1 Tax=Peribacillus loiseleuriae TaxID=1679170 RepID=UPI003D013361